MEEVSDDSAMTAEESDGTTSQNGRGKKSTKWDEVVTALEQKYFQDQDTAESSLRQALPDQLYRRLRRILKTRDDLRPAEEHEESSDGDDSVHDDGSSLKVHPPTKPLSPQEAAAVPNPYLAFLKKPRHRAAVWRPLLPTIIGPGAAGLIHHPDSTLAQKADAVTEAITRQFCEWARTLGDDGDQGGVTEKQLAQLFEVGFNDPVARAIKVNVRHLPVVPDDVARALNVPQATVRWALRRELLRDLKAAETRPRVAFGRTLPPGRRTQPAAAADLRAAWLGPSKRRAGAPGVWAGAVTRLSSTKAFVKFLKEHPEKPRPQCLVEAGFFNVKTDATGSGIISDSEDGSIEIEYSLFANDKVGATAR